MQHEIKGNENDLDNELTRSMDNENELDNELKGAETIKRETKRMASTSDRQQPFV